MSTPGEVVLIDETRVRAATTPWREVRAATRLDRLRARRDPLLRRMIGIADVGTAVVAASVLAGTVDASATAAAVALVVVLWIVVAKLHGLYDRDHRALRHLTVDEIPELASCSLLTVVVASAVLDVAGVQGDRKSVV